MKRIIVILISLCMLFIFSAASAETPEIRPFEFQGEFTLHNGTTFGMTGDEIIAQEGAMGYETTGSKNVDYLYTGYGPVYGVEKASVEYFVIDGGVFLMSCRIPNPEIFDQVESDLVSEYGETDFTDQTSRTFPYIKDRDPSIWTVRTMLTGLFSKTSVTRYSQRLILLESGEYVLIEHYCLTDVQFLVKRLLTGEEASIICGTSS